MAYRLDPVCCRRVETSAAAVMAQISRVNGQTYYFCSMECKHAFERDPDAHRWATDVVCGAEVERARAEAVGWCADHNGQHYWFCSARCCERFVCAPESFHHVHTLPQDHLELPDNAAEI